MPKTQPATQDSPIITMDEASTRTTLSRRTIQRMVERGELRGTKVGRRWLISRASVDELLAPVITK